MLVLIWLSFINWFIYACAALAKFGLKEAVSEYFGRKSEAVAPIKLLFPSIADGLETTEGLSASTFLDFLLVDTSFAVRLWVDPM